ncbi:MAG: ABC transporter substrate-binding protein [Candidatus Binatia bacterium]
MKKLILALIGVWFLLVPCSSEAQKVYRIGGLSSGDQFLPSLEGFRSRMKELGYIDGKNVHYDFHNSKGDPELLKTLAQNIVHGKPDVIVTSSSTATAPLAKATEGRNIPVVFLSAGNPLKFVKSYARPGNNITGISNATMELIEKRFELLKELDPSVKRVAALNNPKGINYQENATSTREAAKRLGLTLLEVEVTSREEIAKVLPNLTRNKVDAIAALADTLITSGIEMIVDHSIKERLPVIPMILANVNKGCLATYAADYFALGQQGAVMVDKILKGSKPADLPVEQPYKLKLIINLKTAKAIGLKISREMLLRADEVIE